MVTVEDVVAGFVPKVPVMPVGQPEVASITPALKPLAPVIVTLAVVLVPATTVAAPALKLKLGGAPTVSAMVVLTANEPLVPVTVSV